MPSRFDPPPNPPAPGSFDPNDEHIDTSRSYDIYCEEARRIVAYRNARFKRRRELWRTHEVDRYGQFLELELASGKTLFIRRHSVLKFCEPGADAGPEVVEEEPS